MNTARFLLTLLCLLAASLDGVLCFQAIEEYRLTWRTTTLWSGMVFGCLCIWMLALMIWRVVNP